MTNDEKQHKRGAQGYVFKVQRKHDIRWGYTCDLGKNENGKRRQTSCKTFKSKTEAVEALNVLLLSINKGTNVDPDAVTFGSFFSEWIEAHGSLRWASSTRETSQKRARYALALFGHVQLQKLTEEMLENGLVRLHKSGGLHGRPLSAKTTREVAALIGQCLAKAYRRGKITRNPMPNVELPKMVKAEPKKPTEGQYERLLERVAKTRYLGFVALAGDSGLRRSEQVSLRWSDINFGTGEVRIERSLSVTREGGWEIKLPKSGKPRSHIVSESTLNILREHRAMIEKEKRLFGSDYKDNDLVFCREDGSFYSPNRITNRIGAFMKECGCEGLSLHKLRHFSASYYLSRGVPIATVSERLGHSDPAITLRIYTHSMPDDDRRAADVWDKNMGDRIQQLKAPVTKPGKLAIVPASYVTEAVTETRQPPPKLYKVKG